MYSNLLVAFAGLAAAAVPQPPLVPRLFSPTDVRVLPHPVDPASLSTIFARAGNPDDHTIPNAKFQGLNGYQWDEDVEGDKYPHTTRVINAWNTALEMATAARDSLKDLTPDALVAKAQQLQDADNAKRKKPRKLTDNQKKLGVRQWIASQFPAYTQMFGAALDQYLEDPATIPADYGAPKLIHDRFDKLLKNIENLDAVGRPITQDPKQPEEIWKRNKLPIYFTKHETPHDLDGNELCGGTQAFVIRTKDFKELQAAGAGKPDDNAWVINFCKDFFELPVTSELLQDLKDGKKKKEDVCDISKHDGTARVLLHEITHIGFTLNLDPETDMVGFDKAASNSVRSLGSKGNQTPRFSDKKIGSAEVSDGYAWFGVYSYLNALDACQGIHWAKTKAYEAEGGCIDTWPSGADKFVRNKWVGYDKEPSS
ncbi:hypothetical protein F4809DRAFT_656928 [Biscogniauxia mediterranea]|nr:hypothetical protein F4809DRAFT_656928 [Biscogniauxia mediterranea]